MMNLLSQSISVINSTWLDSFREFIDQMNPVFVMSGVVIGLLFIASGIVFLLRKKHDSLKHELQSRVKSWWVMVILFLLAITIDYRLSIVFIAVLSMLSIKEFFSISQLRLADRIAMILAYLAIPIQYWWVYSQWYGMFIVFIPIYMFLVIPLCLVLIGEPKNFTASMGKLHWALMAFVFGISHLAFFLVLEMDPNLPKTTNAQGLLFYVVFLAEFNDILQYLFGKALGKHKLARTISPGKTWEGFLGGFICTVFLAIILRFLTPMDWLHAAFAGVLIGLLGPVGDLVISAIKRDAGVKDSGGLIPGHGGVLDRVDSLCFSVPVFFHFVRYFYGA